MQRGGGVCVRGVSLGGIEYFTTPSYSKICAGVSLEDYWQGNRFMFRQGMALVFILI